MNRNSSLPPGKEGAKGITTRGMILTAMFTAVLAVLSQISIPLPGGVPITLQTFAVAFLAVNLGPKYGTLSVLIYLLIGAAGIPVFSGLRGGLDVLFGPTGGYLIGFLPLAFLCGAGSRRRIIPCIALCMAGLLVCHVIGLLFYYHRMETWILPTVPLMLAKDIPTLLVAVFLGRNTSKRLALLARPEERI